MNTSEMQSWDTSYEWKAVTLLSLGFGLVGLDRFMILPMFPVMMKDLHLGYQNLGEITGVLSIAWGIAALFTGLLSDLVGRRRIVIPAIIIFSLLVGISGLAAGLGTLVVVRAIMGLADGAYTPPSIVATLEASKPTRQGMNLGIEQMMLPLFGLALAPLLVTHLLQIISWRWIFLMVTPFGLAIAFMLYFILKPPAEIAAVHHTAIHDNVRHKWTDLFKYRNITHNMIGMLCWLTALVVTSALLPSYLTDYLHLSLPQMGFVLSAAGFGGTAGAILMPLLSDRVGRRPVMLLCTSGAVIALTTFMYLGDVPNELFFALLMTHFFNFALITLTVGPLSAESVPASLMASASGLVICVGEVFGGGIAPVIAGFVAQRFGIEEILPLAIGALIIGFLNSCMLRETAPRRTQRSVSDNSSQRFATPPL